MRLPARSPRRRRAFLLALGAALAGLLVTAGSAFADAIAPESGGSPNADSIHGLYIITLIIAVVVFVVVEGALLYSVIRFRARRHAVAAQIHGNTRLEIGWTVGAALILVVLAIVTFLKLGDINSPPDSRAANVSLARGVLTASTDAPTPPNGRKYTICVTGRQYIWRYTYGAGCDANPLGVAYSYEEMVAPADTLVVLDIQSTDVAHSWWIPKLGGKFDAIPGYHNYTWFEAPMPPADKPGGVVYSGQCAELCGRNHADMSGRVRVLSPTAFEAWLADQKTAIAQANKLVQEDRKVLQARGDL